MSKHLKLLTIAAFSLLVTACGGADSLYSWNGYQEELLSYYKGNDTAQEFADELAENIEKAEKKGRVPPGVYAEYGYVMLELGETSQAITFFDRERETWPESEVLMSKIIDRLGQMQSEN